MVMPYITSATLIVTLLWVMIRNCVFFGEFFYDKAESLDVAFIKGGIHFVKDAEWAGFGLEYGEKQRTVVITFHQNRVNKLAFPSLFAIKYAKFIYKYSKTVNYVKRNKILVYFQILSFYALCYATVL